MTYAQTIEYAKNMWMSEYGGSIDKIPLIIHTDQHSYMNPTNSKAMWDAVDSTVSWYDVSKVINLGDTTNSYANYNDPVLGDSSLNNYLKATANVPFSKRIEVFGNHDCGSIIDSTLTYIKQEPSYLNPYFKNPLARRTSNNGYFVIYDGYFNVKYVVYSNYDYVDSSNCEFVSPSQYEFLIDELTKNDGYDIIMLGHQDGDIYGEKVSTIIAARHNKSSGSFTLRGKTYSYDFTGCERNLLVCLHGHNHNDNYNYGMGVLSQGFDNYYDDTRPFYFVIVDRSGSQLKAWKVTNTPDYTTYTRPFTS